MKKNRPGLSDADMTYADIVAERDLTPQQRAAKRVRSVALAAVIAGVAVAAFMELRARDQGEHTEEPTVSSNAESALSPEDTYAVACAEFALAARAAQECAEDGNCGPAEQADLDRRAGLAGERRDDLEEQHPRINEGDLCTQNAVTVLNATDR